MAVKKSKKKSKKVQADYTPSKRVKTDDPIGQRANPPKFPKPLNLDEAKFQYNRTCSANDKLTARNGELFTLIQEIAPERIGPQGEILPAGVVKQKVENATRAASTGMRASAEPCLECDEMWEEPSKRGRMSRTCPDCRDGADDE